MVFMAKTYTGETFKWSKQKKLDISAFTFHEIVAGERGSHRSRRPGEAAVLLADPSLRAKAAAYSRAGQTTYDAILARTDRGIRLGRRSEAHLFGLMADDDERWSAVAVELGRKSVGLVPGLWLPDEKRFEAADEVIIAAEHVPIEQIQGSEDEPPAPTYTHVPLIPAPR